MKAQAKSPFAGTTANLAEVSVDLRQVRPKAAAALGYSMVDENTTGEDSHKLTAAAYTDAMNTNHPDMKQDGVLAAVMGLHGAIGAAVKAAEQGKTVRVGAPLGDS